MYTGHRIRRASATLLANAGVSTLCLQELSGGESSKVAKGYLEENLVNKVSIPQKIQVGNVSISNVSKTKESVKYSLNASSTEIEDLAIPHTNGISVRLIIATK
ncbi:hypothetical protein Trydic_g18941 [Trypoxylus dichotomus]